jgi:hypothetical protein
LAASQLREVHLKTYANRLRALDLGIAKRLLASLPSQLQHEAVDGSPGEDEGSAVRLAGDSRQDQESITLAELFRTLAQHYGYPTMFADLTLEPLVAAFFATHTSTGGRYEPIANEPGVIYRWPALRIGKVGLHLLRRNPPAHEYDLIPALDLTHIHSAFARPRNQRAVMIALAFRPFQVNVAEDPAGHPILEAPTHYLVTLDPTTLPTCERFQLPKGAGFDVASIAHDSLDALFPDRIDLGYSFISVAALLSLVAIDPDIYGSGTGSERSTFEAKMSAARTLIQRECFRLLPSFSPPSLDMTLEEAAMTLQLAAAHGRDAARLPMGNREKREEILPDIDRWSERIAEIGRYADQLPVHAVENPQDYPELVDFFHCDPLYRETVERQLKAVRRWNKVLQDLET